MNEDLEKSLFINFPALILGIGTIAPLYAGASLNTNALLGVTATIMLILSNVTLASLRSGTSKNGRIGLAVLVTGSLLALTKTLLAAAPSATPLPVETLTPLLLIVAVMASMTDAYDVKKKLSPALFDGIAIGISFLGLLCLSGVLCGIIGSNTFNGLLVIKEFQPLRIALFVPGALLVAALIALLRPYRKRSAS
jgi:Na+-translocating ferredoxin:NAD+ oxidoreductase RnfE subunit